ncbi:DNA polymerase III subunit gamma/tau [Streptomyces echinatus]|uniref:DNA polymerase III subunit gamma/tau n=1 Tax=Streptomyces echinatus TaxID=67293 RepID=UPI0031EA6643
MNAGARDNFSGSGSEDVLRQALAEQFNVQWKIDAIVDPSRAAPPRRPGAHPVSAERWSSAAPAGGYGGAPGRWPRAPRPRHARAPPSQPAGVRRTRGGARPRPPGARRPPHRRARARPSPRGRHPRGRRPDLAQVGLSGHELIVRNWGRTVMEESPNE